MNINGNKLTAAEGMTLTNGEAFGKTIWLASGDRPENWREVTDAEAETMRTDLEEAQESDYIAALDKLGVSE